MILLYLLLYIPSPVWNSVIVTLKFVCVGSVGYFMWILHRRPDFVRECSRIDQLQAVFRIVLQIVFGFIAGLILFQMPHQWTDFPQALAQLLYAVFFYVTNITSNGKPGRRRKIVLAKLKKMFGLEWIPKPAPVL